MLLQVDHSAITDPFAYEVLQASISSSFLLQNLPVIPSVNMTSSFFNIYYINNPELLDLPRSLHSASVQDELTRTLEAYCPYRSHSGL